MVEAKYKILVVDDEPKIRELIRDMLVDDFDVLIAKDGDEGVELARSARPDVVVLDVLMPGMDGFLACEYLRKCSSTKDTPVIMLTALKDSIDRVQAFRAGADDFVSKPFHPDELIARIQSKIKRFKSLKSRSANVELISGNLSMNLLSRRVSINGSEMRLTVIEFDILRSLLEADGKIRTREDLIRSVWRDSEEVPSRILDSHILTIRRKLKAFSYSIETIYGQGYVIRRGSEN